MDLEPPTETDVLGIAECKIFLTSLTIILSLAKRLLVPYIMQI